MENRREASMKRFTFKGGVHPYDEKGLTADKQVRALEPGAELAFLCSQHIGAPARPVVKAGDYVLKGQLIAEAGSFVSSPVFSSVSGTVRKLEKRRTAAGGLGDAVIVENDRLYKCAPMAILPALRDELSEREAEEAVRTGRLPAFDAGRVLEKTQKGEILSRIRDLGIVGMGGAGFPTHVKLSPKKPEDISFILVNGAECEPYVTCDYRLMIEKTKELAAGLKAVLRLFEGAKGVFCVEDNKPGAIEALRQAVKDEEQITVAACRTKYPQGAERNLIKAVTGREVYSRILPADTGCIVDNMATLFAVFEAVFLGKPLYERLFTVTGDAPVEPGNYLVPVGMQFGQILQKTGGLKGGAEKIIAGGPMMGFAQADLEAVTTKTTGALTCFLHDLVSRQEETPCINCGRCVAGCPERLIPSRLADMAEKKQFDRFEKNYGLECVNCGSCSWSCPAKRPLAAQISMARQMILTAKKRAGG